MNVRLVLADPAELVRKCISGILPTSCEITSIVESGRAALRAIADDRPDVLVASYTLPDLDGLTLTREALDIRPELRILLLANDESERMHVEALRAGIFGFVDKSQSIEVLRAAILAVGSGQRYLCTSAAGRVFKYIQNPQNEGMLVSPREWDVLRLSSNGLSNKQIAEALKLSVNTVKSYRRTLMRKLDATNIAELLRAGAKLGLIDS